MARTSAEIKAQMVAQKQSETGLDGLTTDSSTGIWGLFLNVVAIGMALFEQTIDVFKTDTEEQIQRSAPQTNQWLQNKVFQFQYSATNPQSLTLNEDDYSLAYSEVDESLRIVTRNSVITRGDRHVEIKVAKSDPPEPLASPEVDALTAYVQQLASPGISYDVTTAEADRSRFEAEIYFDGQFTSVIEASVTEAIDLFYASIPYNGRLTLQLLVDKIQAVPGVLDVKVISLKCRKDGDALVDAITIYSLADSINQRYYDTIAGYIVSEDTTGHELTDTLTFISQ